MLHFYSDTKIYVHCPSGLVTGGAELLHQLVSFLRDNKRDAFIVYFGNSEHVLPSDYQQYNVSITETIDDNPHNIEFFYEGIFERINTYKSTQKFLWWISVDNFFGCAYPYLSLKDIWHWNKKTALMKFKDLFKAFIFCKQTYLKTDLRLDDLVRMNVPCGYQAEYIQSFLLKSGFKELYPLKDYINTDHCSDFSKIKKHDIVVYNPKKGMEYTSRIIERAPELKWVPLQGMSRQELIKTIQQAKIYIDFGYHPGKDRLPRECAMNGCCIITGMRGSAGFFEDVALPSKYKFDEKKSSLDDILSIIRWTLVNYDVAIDDFSYYRNLISQEKAEFEQQIKNLFQIV